jgi:hypothetical protein
VTEHINGGNGLAEPHSRIRVATAEAPASLETLAAEINDLLATADKHQQSAKNARIAAGERLLECKHRVERGEAGAITWAAWVKKNIKRSPGDTRKVLALARAADPEQAHATEKARNRAAVARHRARRAYVSAPPGPAVATAATEPSSSPPRSSRERWADACARAIADLEELRRLQGEYQARLADLPENQRGSVTSAMLREIVAVDITAALVIVAEAQAADLPQHFDETQARTGGLQ